MALPTPDQLQTAYDNGTINGATLQQGIMAFNAANPQAAPAETSPQSSSFNGPAPAPQLPPGTVGDQGSAQAAAATQAPPPAASQVPTFDPSAIDGLYKAGKLTPQQYASMGGTLPPNAASQPMTQGQSDAAAQGQSAVPTPATAPQTPPNLTPPPQSPATAPAGQPSATSLTDLDKLMALQHNAPVHPLGLSKADKTYQTQLDDLKAKELDVYQRGVDQNETATRAFADQSNAVNEDAQAAKMIYDQHTQENQAKFDKLLSEAQDSKRNAQSELDKMVSQGIDPNHYWADKSTGQKIGFAFAMALGALGQGMTKGAVPNAPMQMIQSAISEDIDAQKANLSNHIDLIMKKQGIEDTYYNRQSALLSAERDSLSSSYAVANNTLKTQLTAMQGNNEAQQNGIKLSSALQAQYASAMKPIIQAQYELAKRAETTVGGGKTILQQLQERVAMKNALDTLNGTDQGSRKTEAEIRKTDAEANKAATGTTAMSSRLVKSVADLDANEAAAKRLDTLLQKGSSMSLDDRAAAQADATQLRNAGYTNIPENPLQVVSSSAARRAGLAQVLLDVRKKRNQMKLYAGQGGGSSDETNPADLPEAE